MDYNDIDYNDMHDRVELESMEFVTAIHWIGLLKGVQLDAQDNEEIIRLIGYHIIVECGPAEFLCESCSTSEAYQ